MFQYFDRIDRKNIKINKISKTYDEITKIF